MSQLKRVLQAAHELAMMAMQSGRYAEDSEFHYATNNVLASKGFDPSQIPWRYDDPPKDGTEILAKFGLTPGVFAVVEWDDDRAAWVIKLRGLVIYRFDDDPTAWTPISLPGAAPKEVEK